MKQFIIGTLLSSVVTMYGTVSVRQMFDEMDQHMLQMHEQMDRVFTQMSENSQAVQLKAPSYALSLQEKDDSVQVELSLPARVTASDVSVEMEDDALDVLVQSHHERVELKIFGNHVTMSSSTTVRQEEKDAKGGVRVFSSGSSHMAQTLPLPTKIDLQRRAPQADLTDGLLTITLAKKGAQKIPVTTTASSAQVVMQAPNEEIIDFEK